MFQTFQPHFSQPQAVACWARDAQSGRITAVDGRGDVLMSIGTNPMFGPRLAAAFSFPMCRRLGDLLPGQS